MLKARKQGKNVLKTTNETVHTIQVNHDAPEPFKFEFEGGMDGCV